MVDGNLEVIGVMSSVGPTITEAPVSTIPLRVTLAGLNEVPFKTMSSKGINLKNDEN